MDTSVCSNTLTKCQQSYAQIEKVALTIAFGCEQFLQYILKKCELDHKTLQSMLKKSFHHAPARLQKLLHSLQKYNFNVIFKPGKSLFFADTLSIVFLDPGLQELKSITQNEWPEKPRKRSTRRPKILEY